MDIVAREMWILSRRDGRCQGDVDFVWEKWKMPGGCVSCLGAVEDAREMCILSRRGRRCQGDVILSRRGGRCRGDVGPV